MMLENNHLVLEADFFNLTQFYSAPNEQNTARFEQGAARLLALSNF